LFLSLLLIAGSVPAVAADTSAASNRIDELLTKGLQKKGLKPNALVDDATFLRRAYLDRDRPHRRRLGEANAFLDFEGRGPARRSWSTRLLASDGYVQHALQLLGRRPATLKARAMADSATSQNYLNFLRHLAAREQAL